MPLPEFAQFDPETATFFGDILHVASHQRYLVLQIEDDEHASIVTEATELGNAHWSDIGRGYVARIQDNRFEVMAPGSASAPAIAASRSFSGSAAGPIAAGDGRAFMCGDLTNGSDYRLLEIDVGDPLAPGELVPLSGFDRTCDSFGQRVLANESLWVGWGPDQVGMFDLAQGGASLGHHAFAPDGIHQYGFLTAAETDGEIVAVTMDNEAHAFVYYPKQVGGPVTYTSFGSGPKQLLAVIDGIAYLALPAADGNALVISFDVRDRAGAARTKMAVTLVGRTPLDPFLSVLATSPDRILVASGDQMFAVPLGAERSLRELEITATPEGCR